MSNLVRFEKVDNELNILRIGGKSFLPPDVEWPTNPNGEKMVFIFNITTLIISKKPGNTGISRDIRTEFTTDLLLSD